MPVTFVLLLGCCWASKAFAQETAYETGKRIVVAKGAAGVRVGGFVTTRNIPAKAKTLATVRWEDAGLAVSFDCVDQEIVTQNRPRDDPEIGQDDCVHVFLDVHHAHRILSPSWFHFVVSASSEVFDERGPLTTSGNGLIAHDVPGLRAKVDRTASGWRASITIPWADLGAEPKPGDVWGINLARSEQPGNQLICYAPTWGPLGNIDQWGHLVFVEPGASNEPTEAMQRNIDGLHPSWIIKEVEMNEKIRPWKYDVDILRSSQYEALGQYAVYCDENDHLWLNAGISFNVRGTTDAWVPQGTGATLLSQDKGLTWKITDRPNPRPRDDHIALPDGSLVRTSSSGWRRYPRSEIKRLREKGHHVWDLGEEHDYCAIHYGMKVSRSLDGGKTWKEKSVCEQFPFFAHFVLHSSLGVLDDGTLIEFAYGYGPEARNTASGLGGRSNGYILRSPDGGDTWTLIMMADGRHSPSLRGFGEIYSIVYGDGRIFALLRTELKHHAYSVWSGDGGLTWSEPQKTPIRAKHPRPTLLNDGTILCTYQRRFAQPYGVRARFTADYGKTWTPEVVIRDDIPVADGLHQPNTTELSDGTLFTSFDAKKYDDQGREWPFVGGSRWTRNYRGSYGPKLEVPPPNEKFNYEK